MTNSMYILASRWCVHSKFNQNPLKAIDDVEVDSS